FGASAYRVMNRLARLYGPVFAEVPPANEGAILYSLTQDLSEKRNLHGTPHWERVFTLYGAGLMAGISMESITEEEMENGRLLSEDRPRVPTLFFAGQSQELPQRVQRRIGDFRAAGGHLFDVTGRASPDGRRLLEEIDTLRTLFHQGYAADSAYPLFFPV